MSNAKPMSTDDRELAYLAQSRRMTVRQFRQLNRMGTRELYRDRGDLPHGGSGIPVRRPLARSAASRKAAR